jgi:2-polyprenyl-3-methyl-5-hydroxy-6-metoxy-1,4-benzoquinol methylase
MSETDADRQQYWREHYAAVEGELIDWPSGAMFTETLATALRFVGDVRGKRVLEAGCGLGSLAVILSVLGADVTAFDVSKALIERNRGFVSVEWHVADLADDSTWGWDRAFDVVTCVEALHAVPTGDALVRLWSQVASGGRLVAILPNVDSPIAEEGARRSHGTTYFGLSRSAFDPVLRRMGAVATWRLAGLELADDQRLECYDSRRLYSAEPYSWILVARRA